MDSSDSGFTENLSKVLLFLLFNKIRDLSKSSVPGEKEQIQVVILQMFVCE